MRWWFGLVRLASPVIRAELRATTGAIAEREFSLRPIREIHLCHHELDLDAVLGKHRPDLSRQFEPKLFLRAFRRLACVASRVVGS